MNDQYRLWAGRNEPTDTTYENVNFAELCEVIERMNAAREKLQTIDRLLLDIQVTDGESVKFMWDDALSKGNYYSFDIAENSMHLTEFAEREKEKLHTSLLNDLHEIDCLRRGKNKGKNNNFSGRGEQ